MQINEVVNFSKKRERHNKFKGLNGIIKKLKKEKKKKSNFKNSNSKHRIEILPMNK